MCPGDLTSASVLATITIPLNKHLVISAKLLRKKMIQLVPLAVNLTVVI